ncbi:hypothetical protein CGLO_11871 [Colletotrichum gloeosporioides Cg-14]|uniref:Uncharacterized protein n=1 Tax=Colletotrichum gloeosporioides (strain Cg-14) TaxID=1237896 RepID=T0KA26_COLGC|nr:hypothetical protein CGLO_11871 [Colletotrichum gloeosporioides Cg-14]
MTDEAPINRR